MLDLVVTRALPDPPGKDRRSVAAPDNDQLNSEWLEFANGVGAPVALQGVTLAHRTFDRTCRITGEESLFTFSGQLPVGNSIRVHSGSGLTWQDGVIWHMYLGRSNYTWNNACGDTAVLRDLRGAVIDWASYDPQPPEGSVLSRIPGTNKLTPAWARTA